MIVSRKEEKRAKKQSGLSILLQFCVHLFAPLRERISFK